MLVPILVNIILLAAIVLLAVLYAAPLVDYLIEQLQINPDSWFDYLTPLLAVVLTGIVVLAYLLVYKYLVLTLISPFLALLSEKVGRRAVRTELSFFLVPVIA